MLLACSQFLEGPGSVSFAHLQEEYYARSDEKKELAAQKEEIAALKATNAFQETKIERLETKLAGMAATHLRNRSVDATEGVREWLSVLVG